MVLTIPDDVDLHHNVCIGVHFKPTSLGIPLSASSGHPRQCLHSWKYGEIRRFSALSSCRQSFVSARMVLLERLKRYYDDPTIIGRVAKYDPFVYRNVDRREPSQRPREASNMNVNNRCRLYMSNIHVKYTCLSFSGWGYSSK